ncbi:MAG TPA: type II secretion system protein GspM [Polyangiales bacterium]
MPSFFDALRDYWEKLSDRERKMLSGMGAVLLTLIVFVTIWTTSSAVAEVEEEREAIRRVLADIDRAGDLLAKRRAERLATEARYQLKAPALAAYMERKAKEQGLEVRQVSEEPEKELNGYRRQSVRVSLSGVSLRPIMHLLTAIEQEPAPMAIERLVIEHYSAGDSYKVDVGVSAFDAPEKGAKAGKAAQP